MFRGTTIEDLTALVQRAEAHAEQQGEPILPRRLVSLPAAPSSNTVYEVAPAYMLGAA